MQIFTIVQEDFMQTAIMASPPPAPLSLWICVSSVLDLKQGSHLQCRGDHTLCASISRDHVVCTDC